MHGRLYRKTTKPGSNIKMERVSVAALAIAELAP
jgi:hypothetical protein